MRCPYCSVVNKEGAAFCTHCGRDLTRPVQRQAGGPIPQQPMYPPVNRQRPLPTGQTGQPAQRISYPPTPSPGAPPSTVQRPGTQQMRPQTTMTPPAAISYAPVNVPVQRPSMPPASDPPGPFPPKTIAQLRDLETGALPYILIDDTTSYGRRKVVRIKYARSNAWQQVATLAKALREYDDTKLETIIIQGFFDTVTEAYATYGYSNGQLLFNRNVRLGSQILQRYQIETGNGFASDSLRIVLADQS